MKKFFFKVITFSVCISVLAGSISHGPLKASAKEDTTKQYSAITARGVWHRPNSSGRETNLAGLCSVLDQMAMAGINMVFLETFYHGMTVFKTNLVPYYTGFEKYDYGEYPDYLTAFAAEAKKRGIEVHAWVESFYIGVKEDTPLVKYFPDWLLINESGKIRHTTEGADLGGYIFLDPANADAREYLLKFYDELLTKVPDVCGLNLDYIRYPVSDFYSGTDTGYTDVSMSGFAKKHGLTINESNKYQDFKAQIRERSLVGEWTDYRAAQVTAFVSEVSEMVNKKHRDSIISVAVHPDINNAYNQKKQDFITWVEKGYIDVVTPMVYYYSASQISSALSEMLPKFDGVYCYSGLYTTYHNQSTDELEAHINASDNAGADGFVLFESVKTFFTPKYDYSGFLFDTFGQGAKLTALPHRSSEVLIDASTDIIADSLIKRGKTQDEIAAFVGEMERIALIGEDSASKMDATIEAIKDLRNNRLPDLCSGASLSDAEAALDLLIEHLEVRKTRLSFKGYSDTDEAPKSPDDEATPDDGEITHKPSDNKENKNLLDIIRGIIKKIVIWFKNLFNID